MFYLATGFSLDSLDQSIREANIHVTKVSESDAAEMLRSVSFISVVWHPAAAAVLTRRLGSEVPVARTALTISTGDIVLVAQDAAPRQALTETEMDAVPIRYFLVSVKVGKYPC